MKADNQTTGGGAYFICMIRAVQTATDNLRDDLRGHRRFPASPTPTPCYPPEGFFRDRDSISFCDVLASSRSLSKFWSSSTRSRSFAAVSSGAFSLRSIWGLSRGPEPNGRLVPPNAAPLLTRRADFVRGGGTGNGEIGGKDTALARHGGPAAGQGSRKFNLALRCGHLSCSC
jgi:hypothetical protein